MLISEQHCFDSSLKITIKDNISHYLWQISQIKTTCITIQIWTAKIHRNNSLNIASRWGRLPASAATSLSVALSCRAETTAYRVYRLVDEATKWRSYAERAGLHTQLRGGQKGGGRTASNCGWASHWLLCNASRSASAADMYCLAVAPAMWAAVLQLQTQRQSDMPTDSLTCANQ